MTLIQRRSNVVCPSGMGPRSLTHWHNILPAYSASEYLTLDQCRVWVWILLFFHIFAALKNSPHFKYTVYVSIIVKTVGYIRIDESTVAFYTGQVGHGRPIQVLPRWHCMANVSWFNMLTVKKIIYMSQVLKHIHTYFVYFKSKNRRAQLDRDSYIWI